MTSWVRQHEAWDLLAVDHLPACPDCGDVAHPGSTVCDGCGTHLFVRVISAAARDLSAAREQVDEETA